MSPIQGPEVLAPTAFRRVSTQLLTAAAVFLAVLLPGVSASAATPLGVEFGKSKFTSSIDARVGETDDDVYVAALLGGERLTATLSVPKGSSLQPVLTLVRPDGTLIQGDALGLKFNKKRTKVKLSKFTIDTSGVWGVRVAGAGVTTGAYALATKISKAPKTKLKDQRLDAAGQATRDHVFGGADGALFSFKLAWSKKQSAVSAAAIEDPQGDDVPGAVAAVQAKGANKLLLKNAALSTGAGDYTFRTMVDAGTASYSLTYSVTPGDRPSTGKKPVQISATEPILAIRANPLVGVEGTRLRVAGLGFSTAGAPTVLFGDLPGTGVTVGGGGTFLDVDVPAVPEGELLSMSVQNPDGQASRRDAYFLAPPPPVIADLRDVTGFVRRGGSSAGGESLRILGANFSPPVTVTFGGNGATVVEVAGDLSSVLVTSPAGVPGTVGISLTDGFGRSANAAFLFTYKVPPAFAATPFDPPFAAVAGGTTVTLTGTGFEPDDSLVIGSTAVSLTNVNSTTATFSSPPLPAGSHAIRILDRVSTSVSGPPFIVEAPPDVTSVVAIAGPFAAPDEIPLAGGTTLRVTGTGIRATNTVELDGNPITASNVTATSFEITPPASATYGGKLLMVTDMVGQQGGLSEGVKYVGFSDATVARAPAGSAVDDYGAFRGAIGDLDNGGAPNDLVIGSYDGTYYPPGTRSELTRLLLGNGTQLRDRTATNMPAAFSDPGGIDPWLGEALAIGDIDRTQGPDIIAVGPVYDPNYQAYYDDVRIFKNDGSGSFTFDSTNSAIYVGQYVPVYDTVYMNTYPFFVSQDAFLGPGASTAVGLGDLDGDSDLDVVVGTTRYRAGTLFVPQNYVSTSVAGAYTSAFYAGYYYNNIAPTYAYAPGLLLFDNDIAGGNGLVEVSFPRLPQPGAAPSQLPAFHAEDIALGDLDRDNDIDIVVTWSNPLTTTPYGRFTADYYGTSYDSARVATAVLTNDGRGFFTDRTANWLPAASGNELWQGHRLKLADLDGDSDLDLVIVHGISLDAHTAQGPTFGTSALRILRNDGPATGFTDVTSTALPSVPLQGTRNDNLRGFALAIRDVNGDGELDILVGTPESLDDSNSVRVRATRLLLGRAGSLTFGIGNEFLPPPTIDSGDADDLLLGDLAGLTQYSLILLSELYPSASTNGEYLRVFDWNE